MSQRIKRFASVAVATAGLAGAAVFATAPAAHASTVATDTTIIDASPCPRPYYGVAVYDKQGNLIAYACIRG